VPEYLYKNTKTEEIRSIIQTMKEEHIYRGDDDKEPGWVRVFAVPQMTFDSLSKIDPFSRNEFDKYTGSKAGTYNDVMEASAELSEKREKIAGKDPIKEKYFNDYSKKTGKTHPKARPTKFEKGGITVDVSD